MSRYNATVRRLDPQTGAELGVFLAEVDEQDRMLRSNAVQFTGLEGSVRYDQYIRRCGDRFEVTRDGGDDYRRRLLGLALPPAYQLRAKRK
jgi:hypothetical protein